MTEPLESMQFLPRAETASVIGLLRSILDGQELPDGGRVTDRLYLAVGDSDERVELPSEVCDALRRLVVALDSGLAVAIVPEDLAAPTIVTTQEAADLLGVSRPTVVRLLEAGRIAYERVGTHRRLLRRDVLLYREARRQEQYAVLDAMGDLELGMDDVAAEVVERRAGEARRAVAARRHARGL